MLQGGKSCLLGSTGENLEFSTYFHANTVYISKEADKEGKIINEMEGLMGRMKHVLTVRLKWNSLPVEDVEILSFGSLKIGLEKGIRKHTLR